jgi:pyruvate dehydrogenase E2 component (dihydrolipoamide acetyltransferase)
MTGMRKVIAERMVTAKTTAAHTYAFFEIDVTKLVAARRTMLDKAEVIGSKVSLIALQVKALALACRQVPICNATINGDAISVWDNVNVGIAVALPGKGEYDSGLVVPVVRDAHAKSVLEIDAEVKALVGKARKGELTAAEMADGTITLSSTGGFAAGTWAVSTPLLNLPQVMNFQPGTPVEKPVVVDGQIVVRTMLPCGLSFDHRAMDGEPVGRFVQQLIDLLGHPELMLL